MHDLRGIRVLEEEGLTIKYEHYKDPKGAGKGLTVDYNSVRRELLALDALLSSLTLS